MENDVLDELVDRVGQQLARALEVPEDDAALAKYGEQVEHLIQTLLSLLLLKRCIHTMKDVFVFVYCANHIDSIKTQRR